MIEIPLAPILRTFDIGHVEVLRGPQSTLYGGGAMGRVIKYVPNKPNTYKFEGEVALSGNTLKNRDPSYYGDLMLNAPNIIDFSFRRKPMGISYCRPPKNMAPT